MHYVGIVVILIVAFLAQFIFPRMFYFQRIRFNLRHLLAILTLFAIAWGAYCAGRRDGFKAGAEADLWRQVRNSPILLIDEPVDGTPGIVVDDEELNELAAKVWDSVRAK